MVRIAIFGPKKADVPNANNIPGQNGAGIVKRVGDAKARPSLLRDCASGYPRRAGPASSQLTTNSTARSRTRNAGSGSGAKHFRPFYDYGTVATENRLSKYSVRPLGLCGQRLPEFNLIPIQVIDPGKATVGFIHSFGVNLYSLLL